MIFRRLDALPAIKTAPNESQQVQTKITSNKQYQHRTTYSVRVLTKQRPLVTSPECFNTSRSNSLVEFS